MGSYNLGGQFDLPLLPAPARRELLAAARMFAYLQGMLTPHCGRNTPTLRRAPGVGTAPYTLDAPKRACWECLVRLLEKGYSSLRLDRFTEIVLLQPLSWLPPTVEASAWIWTACRKAQGVRG